jgi:hypothetical protein
VFILKGNRLLVGWAKRNRQTNDKDPLIEETTNFRRIQGTTWHGSHATVVRMSSILEDRRDSGAMRLLGYVFDSKELRPSRDSDLSMLGMAKVSAM